MSDDATPGTWNGRDARALVERQTNLPQLGNPPKGNSPGEAQWYRAVHDNLKAGLGTAASAGDRFVTLRDLLNSGAVTYADGTGPSNSTGGIAGLPLIPPLPKDPSQEVSTIPPDPIDFTATAGLTSIILSWDVAGGLYSKVGYTEIFANATDDLGAAVLIGTTTARVYADAVGSTGVDRYYWIRFVGTGSTPFTGNFFSIEGVHAKTGTIDGTDFSGLLIEAQNIADGAVIESKIADGILTVAKFASSIAPIGVVSTLPDPLGYNGPQVVFLTSDGKIYRYVSGAWTTRIDGGDVSGDFASVVADGSITFAKFATGIEPVGVVGALPNLLPNPPGYHGPSAVILTTDEKLYRLSADGTNWTAATAATDITGALTETQIGDHAITTAKIAAFAITANEIAANSIVTGKIAAGAVTADQLAANSVVAGKVAAGAISSNSLQANAVTAGKIAAGAVSADQIAAGAIRAQNLLITASSLIPDTSFAGGAGTWESFVDRYASTDSRVPPGAPTPFASQFNGRLNRYQAAIAVKQGDEFRARVVFNNSGTGNAVGVAVQFSAADGSVVTSGGYFVGSSLLAGWQSADYTFAAPVGAVAMSAGPFIDYSGDGSQSAWFGDFNLVRMADASLIVDGAVTADKISANAVVAGKIAAAAIAAVNIIAGSITGDRIAASTLTAANILAGTITGDLVAANTITAQNIASRTIQAVQIAANTITAYEIQANSISSDRLTVGAQGALANLLKNSDWTENTGTNSGPTSLKNWTWYSNIPGAYVGRNYANGSVWNVGLGGAYLYDSADPGSTTEYNLLTSDPFAVSPGQYYEASCYVSVQRCTGAMYLHFLRADGSECASGGYTASVSLTTTGDQVIGGPSGISSMVRLWSKGIAPPDAATGALRLYKFARNASSTTTSYLFLNKAFVTLDAFNQSSSTNQSPWRDGGLTTIDGNGIITNSIDATKIKAGGITADKISVIELSDIAQNAGIIVSGVLRNVTNSAALNLNAINGDDFIRVGNYVRQYDGSYNPNIALRADGSAYFSREVISRPRRIAFGNYLIPASIQPVVYFAYSGENPGLGPTEGGGGDGGGY